jgi:hypothetical protein
MDQVDQRRKVTVVMTRQRSKKIEMSLFRIKGLCLKISHLYFLKITKINVLYKKKTS